MDPFHHSVNLLTINSVAPQAIHWFEVETGDRIQSHHQSDRVAPPLDLGTDSNGPVPPQRQFTNN